MIENRREVASEPVLVVVREERLLAVRNHLSVGRDTNAWWAAIDEGEVLAEGVLLLSHVSTACLVLESFDFCSGFFLDLIYFK